MSGFRPLFPECPSRFGARPLTSFVFVGVLGFGLPFSATLDLSVWMHGLSRLSFFLRLLSFTVLLYGWYSVFCSALEGLEGRHSCFSVLQCIPIRRRVADFAGLARRRGCLRVLD